MVDRIAGWLFRRFRRHYIGLLEVLCDAFIVTGVAGVAIASIGFYLRFSWSEFAITALVTAALVVLGVRAGVAARRRDLQILRRWLAGEPVDPNAVHERWLVMMSRVVVSTMAFQVPIHATITVALLARYGHFDGAAFFAVEVGLLAVLLAAALFILQGYQVLIRPAVAVVEVELGHDATVSVSGLSIAARLTMGVVSTVLLGGAVAVTWSGRAATPTTRFGLAMVAAVVFTAYAGTLYRVGLIDAALAPLRDLSRATVRVRAGDFSTPVTITSADELGELAAAFNDMQRGLRERESLHTAFGSYVDPALARRLLEQGDSVFAGEEIDVSVFFADIRDFTGFAERASVSDAVATLNRFFSIVVRVISDHGGHTNAYLGDGVLGVFGTPLPLEDHADRAVAAALAVCDDVRREFEGSLRIGIGVNTGRVIAGTVGGAGKLEFTVIGDPVNVAARVEQLTKETGDSLLITDATRAAMRVDADVVDRGEFEVRGKQHRVRLFSLA